MTMVRFRARVRIMVRFGARIRVRVSVRLFYLG